MFFSQLKCRFVVIVHAKSPSSAARQLQHKLQTTTPGAPRLSTTSGRARSMTSQPPGWQICLSKKNWLPKKENSKEFHEFQSISILIYMNHSESIWLMAYHNFLHENMTSPPGSQSVVPQGVCPGRPGMDGRKTRGKSVGKSKKIDVRYMDFPSFIGVLWENHLLVFCHLLEFPIIG